MIKTGTEPATLHDRIAPGRTEDGALLRAVDNLRKNGQKSSPYKGVTLFRPTMKWRAQISASGKTTSLGDHDTEADAARAFDRAALNKQGRQAKTNFPISDYEDEIDGLAALSQVQVVAMLRSKARKSSTQTSHYRGVSLLKQTGKWHAQINVCGKQEHLGFFSTEMEAAKAYDRSAINKGARSTGKIATNMDIKEYMIELEVLRRVKETALVDALSHENRRAETADLLASGDLKKAEGVFGDQLDLNPDPKQVKSVTQILAKAERCQPKSTETNPLYPNFDIKKEGAEPGALFASPVKRLPAESAARWSVKPRVLFPKRTRPQRDCSDDSETETDDDVPQSTTNLDEQTEPQRRSSRNRGKPAKRYQLALQDIYGNEEEAGDKASHGEQGEDHAPHTPVLNLDSPDIKPRSFKHSRTRDDLDGEGIKPEGKRRKLRPAHVEPAEVPSWELLRAALSGLVDEKSPQPANLQSRAATSAFLAPSESPEKENVSQAATLESKAATIAAEGSTQPCTPTDKCSKAVAGSYIADDKASALSVHLSHEGTSDEFTLRPRETATTSSQQGCRTEAQTPCLFPSSRTNLGHSWGAGDGFGSKGSNLAALLPGKLSSIGGAYLVRDSQEGSVGEAAILKQTQHADSTPSMPHMPSPGRKPFGKRAAKRKAETDLVANGKLTRSAPGSEEEGNVYAKTFTAQPRTNRQRAMMQRRLNNGSCEAETAENKEYSPKSSIAANAWTSGCWSAAPKVKRGASAGFHDDVVSQSSHQQASIGGRALSSISGPESTQPGGEDSHAPIPPRRNRRKFCKPLRAAVS